MEPRKAIYRAYKKEENATECVFHGFFQKNSGYEAGPVAIIELSGGSVIEVEPSYIQFIEPLLR